MAILEIPDEKITIENYFEILYFLKERGIHYEKWILNEELEDSANEAHVMEAYNFRLRPYMEEKGYKTADVVVVNAQTPNLEAIRNKFLREHIHTEDEVRIFVKGQGLFWFHLQDGQVFSLLCQEGDLISVPAKFRHWFDIGENPFVKAIRVFIDPAGWVAHYTESGVDERYNVK